MSEQRNPFGGRLLLIGSGVRIPTEAQYQPSLSGDTAVGQFGVVLGQLPGRGRGRVTCEDGTRDSQRIVDADDRERTEIVTGVGHFGVAGGLRGTSSPAVVQDSATDAVTDIWNRDVPSYYL